MEESDMAFEHAIVLTGGIATGKSTVVQFFLEADDFMLLMQILLPILCWTDITRILLIYLV